MLSREKEKEGIEKRTASTHTENLVNGGGENRSRGSGGYHGKFRKSCSNALEDSKGRGEKEEVRKNHASLEKVRGQKKSSRQKTPSKTITSLESGTHHHRMEHGKRKG